MGRSNTIRGKAFEYAVLDAFKSRLERDGNSVAVDVSDAYRTAERAFYKLDEDTQLEYIAAAEVSVDIILPLEPKLRAGSGEPLTMCIQSDARGQKGDVRDIVCIRFDEGWEIGISCKHNHEALKHPRVRNGADFGLDWIGVPCSALFLERIATVMHVIESRLGDRWRDYDDIHDIVYKPILAAYVDEISRLCEVDSDVPAKLVGYFFGMQDFYKVIAKDRRGSNQAGLTKVMAFNMNGTLGKDGDDNPSLIALRKTALPGRLIEVRMKDNSLSTLIMTFDGGWSISMRLHTADSEIKRTGLKWDVQLEGVPSGIYEQEQPWIV